MARLVTGYDFTNNEVPTKAKIHMMLSNMSIVAISPALINSSLVGMHFGADGTTLPSEGWMWADTNGNLWVRTTNGSCKLWRGHGGWSTNRFPTLGLIDTITLPQGPTGTRAVLRNRVAQGGDQADTNESNVGWFLTADVATQFIGKCEDTAVSGLNIRWVVRGGAFWSVTAAAGVFPRLVRRHASAGQLAIESDPVPTTNAQSNNNIYHGLVGKSVNPGAQTNRHGWLFGAPLRVY